MKKLLGLITLAIALVAAPVWADEYTDAVKAFREAPATAPFFKNSYGYAIFPTIGKGAVGVGGAYGEGRVYKGGAYVGDVSMAQVSIGWQLGGQAFSELIFFENKAAFDKFTNGSFGFDAQASAVAIAVGAGAQAGTSGASANVADKQSKAAYVDGVAVFSMQKGGLMYEAALGGQKFTYHPKK
ncbi:MAG TPA: YSC84-related protein [Spongiibacteraceae bacterium]|jgi:lipid-binding SYLF domain-containing protein